MAATGLLVRYRGEPAFIASSTVRFVRYDVTLSQFPGSELGMALITGRIVPVISVGQDSKALIVCEVEGESVAFSGLDPIRSGFFEGDDHAPLDSTGEPIPVFPIRELIEAARARGDNFTNTEEEGPWLK